MVGSGRLLGRHAMPFLVAAVGCGGDQIGGPCVPGAAAPDPVARIIIAGAESLPDPLPIAAGNSIRLRVLVTQDDGCGGVLTPFDPQSFTWTSSSDALATVYPNGVLLTFASGLVEISAGYQSLTATQRVRIVTLAPVPAMASLAMGAAQSCALSAEGTLYCWGDGVPDLCVAEGGGYDCGADYRDGRLPDAVYPPLWATCTYGGPQLWSDPAAEASDFPCSRVPSRYRMPAVFAAAGVNGGSTVSRFAVCGVTNEGALYCVGSYGPLQRLGGGTVFRTVAVGTTHACALDVDGRAYCWGDNRFGALGDSTRTSHEVPQPVSGDHVFTAIGAAADQTCALAADGRAYCWGGGSMEQGGVGPRETCPLGEYGAIQCNLVPRPVSDTVFEQMSVGGADWLGQHACGLTTEGVAYCWGGNYDGQLGDGTKTARADPAPVAGGLLFRSVSAGSSHTCGIATDDITYCWGANPSGQLGSPGSQGTLLPLPLTGAPVFAEIAAGGWHTCGRTAAGAVWCWGWNEGGQLGNGTLPHRDAPRRIAGQE